MSDNKIELKVPPVLDKQFRPLAIQDKIFLEEVLKSGHGKPFLLALERAGGQISRFGTIVYGENSTRFSENILYIDRLIKTFLWIKGGWKLTVSGPKKLCEWVSEAYSDKGGRSFDASFMSRIYERPFMVDIVELDQVPDENEESNPIGRHFGGCRIGFDAGGSDRKVCAVLNGEIVYSEEVIWHPKTQSDPEYHYGEILTAMKTAASRMPRVDAVGVSSAGVYVDNRAMVASLFRKVPEELYNTKVKDIYIRAVKELGDIPLVVANDGDVTALAGAMELMATNVLGIAMGTSQAGGYVDKRGNLTGWLNELCFVPVDYNPEAFVDEWSGDYGCGVGYFSQDAVIRLAPKAGITLDEALTPAEKLAVVQEMMEAGSNEAAMIFETIGSYLGYQIAHYARFYDIRHVLILGRVVSGRGGSIILEIAQKVLEIEFPILVKKILLHLPDEASRRVGQSIAAASLPKLW